MSGNKLRTVGLWMLAAGVFLLLCAVVLMITVGTSATSVLLLCSIVTNTVAITLIRQGPGKKISGKKRKEKT